MKQGSLTKLISDYPSHGFVIDMPQAKELFHNVEEMGEMDYNLYEIFKERFQNPNEVFYFDLETMRSCITEQEKNDATNSGDGRVSLSVSENKSSKRKPKQKKQ